MIVLYTVVTVMLSLSLTYLARKKALALVNNKKTK